MWHKILIILLCVVFIIILIVKRFAYFRPKYDFVAPTENYLDIREGNLHAWYKPGNSGKIILFCHGNAGNISYRQTKLSTLLKLGHSVLIFDYSGFGQSKGVPSEQMCYSNADIFFSYILRKGYKKENIIPYGESIGSAVAAYISRKYGLPSVIIEGGIPSISELLKYWYPKIGSILGYIFYEFNTISYLQGYKGKILVLHCINDEIIPYSISKKLRDIATLSFDMDGSHNMPVIPWEEVKKFIN